jgi:antitoxin component YwqK of YwqJK toxin-antitoxin module
MNQIRKNFLKVISISITILLLIIGCNNNKSKNFEVKKSKNGIVNGIYSAYILNGDTIAEGQSRFYYPNGQLKEVSNWKDGKLNGQYKKFHNNGMLYYSLNYINGVVKDGPYISFDRYGKISQKANFIGGAREGEVISYFNNGKISEILFVKNDKIDHIVKELDINENEMPLGTLKNGIGSRITYHPNGKINTISIYQDGDLKWRSISIDDKGNIRNSGTFANGIGDLYIYDEFGYRETITYDKLK